MGMGLEWFEAHCVCSALPRAEEVILDEEVYKFALHPEPPLCKGRWLAERRDGGIVAVCSTISPKFHANS